MALFVIIWVVSFFVAAVVLLVLLHAERHTDNPAPVAALAITLVFLPPLGLLATAIFWKRQHRPSHLADDEQPTSLTTGS